MACVIAITGGVACGKSHFTSSLAASLKGPLASLLEQSRVECFSCDETVSKLLTSSEIISTLVAELGSQIVDDNRILDKTKLRQIIFESSEAREKVEGILHPLVLDSARSFINGHRDCDYLLVEIPLLYEVDFPFESNFEVVIGCSKQTQQSRLKLMRDLDCEVANRIIGSQLPIKDKVERADIAIWNDGTIESFEDQIQDLAALLLANIGLWQKK